MVHVNGKKVGGNANISKFIAYVSPYFVVSNGGAYTKHIYAANQRIASKLGNVDGFGADPRRVEMAGGKKYDDNQSGTIKARFEALHIDYSDGNGKKDDEEYEPTMDSEEEEKLIFFYHPDRLGSTSYVTDADGNIAQHVEYIPYGEVFVEERNSQFSTNFLFNAKELDDETGLYYYGARYLDPTGAMWLSVDPVFHAGTSPYAYCLGNPVKMVDPDGRVEFFRENGKHSFSGFDINDKTKYVVKSRKECRNLKRGKITLSQAKSAVRLPSDLALETSLEVLDKTNEAGGLCEIGAVVGKQGQVVIGEPGEQVTEDMTVLRGSLPDYDFPMSEVEASIHSHMTECLVLNSGQDIKYSEANKAGPGDPEIFSQYDCNIIVGKRGAPKREVVGTTIHGDNIYKCSDYRREGIGIFGRNVKFKDESTLWLNKEAVLKIINYGKTQE